MKRQKKNGENTEYEQMSLHEFMDLSQDETDQRNSGTGRMSADDYVNEVTSMELPMDWENFYETDPGTAGVHVESISDGFVKCLNHKGCVDIEYIAAVTGEDYKTVIEKLKGSIYQNPDTWGDCFFKGWETAEEYLSGNIRQKLKSAKSADEMYHGYFAENVRALSEILPEPVPAGDIYVTLGSPWVPVDVIDSFLHYLTKHEWARYQVRHDEDTGTWEIEGIYKHSYFDLDFKNKYGTARMNAYDIFLKTLNMQSVVVTDTIKSEFTKSGRQSVVNKEETVLALEKQDLLIRDFKDWIWKEPKRRKRLERLYEEKYCSVRQRHFDGGFLEFSAMNPEISLYPYQRDAVARILFSGNTLLAHDVGSGKTLVMIAAGMELKRMGLSSQNMYVVPNNLTGQWKEFIYNMYPGAYIKCIEPKDFTPRKREETLADIRDGDYDAVIIAYSCFTQIPISKEYQVGELRRKVEECKQIRNQSEAKATRKLDGKIAKLGVKLLEKKGEAEQEGICFDQLGVTRLFVDEAHNFKNVPIESKIDRIMGISKAGSVKCQDMLDKVRIVQHGNGGGGVVLATGTPITNSITDAYVMQQYLQSGELAILELQNFDSWVGMFAEKSTGFEIDVDTSNYRMATRFNRFHNIPELTAMLSSFSDFHQMDETAGIPEHDGYVDVTVARTKEFADYLKQISVRADEVRNGRVRRTDDNMLKITTDGRKAALDIRLVRKEAGFTTCSKVFQCAEKVADIYKKTAAEKSTQLVFCDTSTPKAGFNMYDELKSLLIKMGVAESEVAYIHDAATETKREKLFSHMRQGKIRVLIGSTFKLGLGVNVQDRLIALHHLDVPWRPADMSQREGRILRQGNGNQEVWLFRYITEGSFDAYSWQLLETKARFIADLLAGTVSGRSGADVDDTVLNYAEVKALAVGNPLIRERVEAANELSRYSILQRKQIAQKEQYGKEMQEIPGKIRKLRELMPLVEADAEFYKKNKREYTEEERREIRKKIFQATHMDEPAKEDVVLLEYQGFEVIVPKNISFVHPVVTLKRENTYSFEIGGSDVGGMIRIDNYLDRLPEEHKRMAKRLEELKLREAFLREELKKDKDYSEEIARLEAKVENLDHLLGVDKEDTNG